MDTRIKNNICPSCKKRIDGNTPVFHDNPIRPGDMTVCMYCQSILIYAGNLTVRLATRQELKDTHPETILQLVKVQEECRKFMNERAKEN